jgi:anti-sigma factor RsiW
MSEHIFEWLPAYHDGELSPGQRKRVETHLQTCLSCRAELQMLTELSALLKADPLPQHTPPERFAAQVQLLLPRSAPRPHAKSAGQANVDRLPRWVLGAPLALIVVWTFLQAALWVTSFVLTTDSIFPGMAPWLASDNSLETLGALSLISFVLLAGAVILWSTWMALWWAWKHNQNLEPVFNHLEKEV